MSGQPHYYFGCVNQTRNDATHHLHHSLAGIATLDLNVLRTLVDGEVSHPVEGCAFIASCAT